MLKYIFVVVLFISSSVSFSQSLVSELPTGPSINDLGQIMFPALHLDPVLKALEIPNFPDAIEVSGNWLPKNTGWKTITLNLIEYPDPAGNKIYLYYGETGVQQASGQNPELSFLLKGSGWDSFYPKIAMLKTGFQDPAIIEHGDAANWKPGIGSWRIK